MPCIGPRRTSFGSTTPSPGPTRSPSLTGAFVAAGNRGRLLGNGNLRRSGAAAGSCFGGAATTGGATGGAATGSGSGAFDGRLLRSLGRRLRGLERQERGRRARRRLSRPPPAWRRLPSRPSRARRRAGAPRPRRPSGPRSSGPRPPARAPRRPSPARGARTSLFDAGAGGGAFGPIHRSFVMKSATPTSASGGEADAGDETRAALPGLARRGNRRPRPPPPRAGPRAAERARSRAAPRRRGAAGTGISPVCWMRRPLPFFGRTGAGAGAGTESRAASNAASISSLVGDVSVASSSRCR